MTPHEAYVTKALRRRGWEEGEIRAIQDWWSESASRPPEERWPAGRYRHIDAKRAETLREMWAEGASIERIAEAIGASCTSVGRYAAHHPDECPGRPRGRHRMELDLPLMAEMRARGMSSDRIGEAVGASGRTVRQRLREMKAGGEKECVGTRATGTQG